MVKADIAITRFPLLVLTALTLFAQSADPRIRVRIEPEYTKAAKKAKIEGLVTLECVVGTDGVPREVMVTRPLNDELDANAVEALKRSLFWPATLDGKPVEGKATVDFSFKLSGASSKQSAPKSAKGRGAPGGIIETRNIPLAITQYLPAKTHDVTYHPVALVHLRLTITPYVGRSFDQSKTSLSVEVTITISAAAIRAASWQAFSNADMVITVDGKALSPVSFGLYGQNSWSYNGGWHGIVEQTVIHDERAIRAIASGSEVYLSVMLPGRPAPSDQISFRLSQDQLNDCNLMIAKYDSLL